jgi:Uma2 family endonuclease
MAHAERIARMSYAEYLERERTSTTKHEYLRGDVFAMPGGTLEQARLAARVTLLIATGIGERPCEIFSSDAKVRVDETDLSTYPDVTVICGHVERSPIDGEAATNPTMLVEVLSETSEAYDRGEKFAHYRRLASLREYVLVSQREPRVEVFRRTAGGRWEFSEATAGGRVSLESIGVELAVDDIYASALAS